MRRRRRVHRNPSLNTGTTGTVIEVREDILESSRGLHRASFPEVGGGYELTASSSLVQAVGDFDGIDFYFRAKYGEWEFQTEDKQGHSFPGGHANFFVRRGTYDEGK